MKITLELNPAMSLMEVNDIIVCLRGLGLDPVLDMEL